MSGRSLMFVTAPTLAVWIGACTGGPLPSTTDAIAETGSDDATDSTGEGATSSESGGTDTGTDDATGSDETTGETTTTGDTCGTPEVVANLTINLDTVPEELACLRKVTERLLIKDVDWTDLAYLPALEQVGRLEIREMDALVDLGGTSLVELDRLSLSALPAFTSTAGLEQLTSLNSLYIGGLSTATIELPIGLPTERIDVYSDTLDMLAELEPQPSGESFEVVIGSATADITGLMACCAFPELVLTSYSTELVDFTDLQGITSMAGLHVFNAGQLTGFAGLEQLESIGTLEVSGTKCDSMDGWEAQAIHVTSLAGLDSLAAIDTLELRYLFELESLAGLPPDATVTSLELRNDSALSYAEAEAFAAAVAAVDPWICGLEGDPICYLDPIEGAPCPQ